MFRRAGNGSLEPVRQRLMRKPRHANRISQSETAQQDNRDNRLRPRLVSLLRHHFFIDRRKRPRLNRKRRRVLRKQPRPGKRQRHPSSHQKPHEGNQRQAMVHRHENKHDVIVLGAPIARCAIGSASILAGVFAVQPQEPARMLALPMKLLPIHRIATPAI